MRILAALLLLGACDGPPPGQCTEQEQCDDGFNCNPPDFVGFCTTTTDLSPECDARGSACTTDKGEDGICWYVAATCGFEHECAPACTSDADCKNDDEICRADGQCTAASCVDGELTCPADTVCVESGGDVNGCMHPACADEDDCGEGQHCVTGRCFLEFGECQSDLF